MYIVLWRMIVRACLGRDGLRAVSRTSAPSLSTSTPQDEAPLAPPECVERKITILDVRFLPVAIPDRRQAFLLFEGITKMGSVAESG
ncbi:Unannotated [Lentimonas sp. CC19]|nr:Unannotated [Lentimonas sp. CC19]CAA6697252.1 Unannotated [Lentimonas sp. CC10]CAA7070446.1 Unannotated [Lentimonas sp. CC11]